MAITRYAGDRFTTNTSDTKPTGVLDGAYLIDTGNLTQYVRRTVGGTSQWSQLAGGGGGGGTPGGANTQVQFNNAGAFGGNANLTFDGSKLAVNDLALSGIIYDSNNSIGNGGMVLTNEGTTGVNWKSIESVLSGVGGSGVANYVARWSDEDTITSGVIQDDGTAVGINQAADPDNALAIKSIANNTNPLQIAAHDGDSLLVFRQTAGDGRLSIKKDGGVETIRLDSDNVSYITGGNFGIGTNNPASKLHVYGGSSGATVDTSSDDLIVENSNHGGISLLVPDNKASVITFGTASDAIGAKLQWDYTNNAFDMATAKTGGFIRFKVADQVEALRITADSNVGIGTTSPDAHLHVSKSAGTTTVLTQVAANSTVGYEIKKTGSTTQHWKIVDGQTVNGTLEFYDATDSATRMAINGSGSVGIGTASPEAALTVAGPNYTHAIFRTSQSTASERAGGGFSSLGHATATSRYARLFLDADGANFSGTDYFTIEKFGNSGEVKLLQYSNANMSFWVNTSTQAMTIKNDGNVGIGTNNPQQLLHLNGSSPIIRFRDSDATGTPLAHIDASGGALKLQADSSDETASSFLTLEVDGSEHVRVVADGKVGIGTTTPLVPLDVRGNITLDKRTQSLGSAELAVKSSVHSSIVADRNANTNSANFMLRTAGTNKWRMSLGMAGSSNEKFSIYDEANTKNVLTVEPGGNIGIGDNLVDPEHRFHVSGDAIISGYLYDSTNSTGVDGYVLTSKEDGPQWKMIEDVLSGVGGNGTANYIPKWIDSDTIGDSVIAESGGNIGIGVTSANAKLKVVTSNTDVAIFQSTHATTANFYLSNNTATANNTSNLYFCPANGINGASVRAIAIEDFSTSANRTADLFFETRKDGTMSEKMRIHSSGNVGIGTNVANQKLHINGSTLINNNNYHYGYTSGGAQAILIGIKSNNHVAVGQDNVNHAATNIFGGTGVIDFSTGGSTRVTITVDGNVGVGTNAPSGKLHILQSGTYAATGVSSAALHIKATHDYPMNIVLDADGSSSDENRIRFLKAGVDKWQWNVGDDVDFYTRTGSSWVNRFVIEAGGNVGIGTATPGTILHLKQDDAVGPTISLTNNPKTAYINFWGATGGGTDRTNQFEINAVHTGYGITLASKDYVRFKTDGVGAADEAMRIDSNGNVGIGTTSPTTKLHVYGNNTVSSLPNLAAQFSATGTGGLGIGDENGTDPYLGLLVATDDFHIKTGGNNNRVTVQADGNVGIGTVTPNFAAAAGNTVKGLNIQNVGQDTQASLRLTGHNATGNPGVATYTELLHAGANLRFDINHNGTVRFSIGSGGAITFNSAYTFPTAIGSAGQVLKVPSSGTVLEWSTETGPVSGTGTTNTIPRWTGTASLGDSIITVPSNTSVQMAGPLTLNYTSPILNIGKLNTSTGNAKLQFNSKNGTAANAYIIEYVKSATEDRLDFLGGGGTAEFSFLNSGQVGIGTTAPDQKLHVNGSAEIDGSIYLNDANTRIHEGSGNSVRLQTNSGYIDVGPQNATYAHFLTDRDRFYFNKELVVDTGIIRSFNEDLQFDASYSGAVAKNIKFRTGNVEKMRMDTAGSFGIGTTGPAAKLDVRGNILRSGLTYSSWTSRSINSITSGGSTINYILIAPKTTTNVRLSGRFNCARGNGVSAVSIAHADIVFCTDNDANPQSGGIHSASSDIPSYGHANFEIVELEYSSTEYYALKISPSSSWVASFNHIEFEGISNNITWTNIDSGNVSNVGAFGGSQAVFAYEHANVGIGTNNPSARLHITSDGSHDEGAEIVLRHDNNNSTDVVSTLSFQNNAGQVAMIQAGTTSGNTNGYISLFTDNSGTSAEKMRIISDGNVGIATTAPASLLHVGGAAAAPHAAADDFVIAPAATDVGMTIRCNSNAGTGSIFFADTAANAQGTIRYNHNSDYMSFYSSGDFFFDGSVGIGTAGPSALLHIRKIDLVDDSRNALLLLDGRFAAAGVNSGDEVGIAFRVENSGGGAQQTTSITSSYQPSYNSLNLQPAGGKVGIGTNDPKSKLDIGGSFSDAATDLNATNAIAIKQASTDSRYGIYLERAGERRGYYIGMGGPVDSLTFERNNVGTKSDVMSLTRDGFVGIGTNNPAGLLSLAKGTRTLDIKLETSPATGDMGVQFRAGSGDYLGLAAGGGSGLGIVIDSSNNVGIGTTNPGSYKLLVNGNSYLDGTAYVDDNLTVDGDIDFETMGDYITFYGDSGQNHSISSRNSSGVAADDIRINTYGALFINLDSNGNDTSETHSNFQIGRHAGTGAVSASDLLLNLSGETGKLRLYKYGSGTHTGTAAYQLSVDSSGNIIETTDGGGNVSGSGTSGKLTKWSGANGLTDSSFFSESGTTLTNTAITNNFTGANTQIRLPNYGRIGIGTNSATSPFLTYLADNSTFSGAEALIRAYNGGNRGAKGHSSGSNLLKLDFNDACAMIVNKDGSVGIGTTSPDAVFRVVNSAASGGTFKFTDGSSRTLMDLGGGVLSWNAASVFGAGSWAGTADHEFRTLTTGRDTVYIGGPTSGTNHALYVDGSRSYFGGSVGIGTVSPVAKLDVRGDFIMDKTNNGYGGMRLWDDTSGDYNVYLDMGRNQSNTQFHIRYGGRTANTQTWNSGTDIAVFSRSKSWIPNGSVGIGITNPSQKLHVNGNCRIDGTQLISDVSVGYDWLQLYEPTGDGGSKIVSIERLAGGARILMQDHGGTLKNKISSSSAENTYFNNGSVGIGTASPVYGLDNKQSSIRTNSYTAEKVFGVSFANSTANQKVDLSFPYFNGGLFWGYLEVTITSTYSNQLSTGKLSKVFSVGLNAPGGTSGNYTSQIYDNTNYYTSAYGAIATQWGIEGINFNSTTGQYYITIAHRVSTGNSIRVSVKAYGYSADYLGSNRFGGLSAGSVYTTDTTVFDAPVIQVPEFHVDSTTANDNLKIGTRGGHMNLFSVTDAGAGAPLAFEGSQFRFITGSVGIGTASISILSGAKLDVRGNIYSQGYYFSKSGVSAGGSISLTNQAGDANSNDVTITAAHSTNSVVLRAAQKVEFWTYAGGGYNQRMVISNNGCVGIGTATPRTDLHVYGTGVDNGLAKIRIGGNTNNTAILELAETENNSGVMTYGFSVRADGGSGGDSTNDFQIRYHDNSTSGVTGFQMERADGNIGIGTTSGGYKLNVQGNVYISGTLTEASSLAIKESIETFEPSLDIINKIRPVKYDKKTTGKKEIGLIAEELAELFPELVEKDKNGNPSGVNYSRAVTVLLGGFKELYKEVQELKKRI